ncbi:hypothetical protein IHE55_12785 [Streptomyces pactum]|uniref:Heparin-binding hemagglutinin n=1 Tax=Streptomyces pactum TaxID=68249 RepID=A0ABS0NKE0_9ACTN|nr:hypothetical protein [Streptomyces pactum]MBH5335628.1 hypothetical protein [Streptomyces pactum]
MAITDDVRKSLTDPTPLYFVAGTADLAAQKLREVPALVEKLYAEAPERIAAVRNTDPQEVQEKFSQQAKEAQEKLTELFGSLDTDLRKIRETAQDLALQGVGRAAEFAVRARERYEEVAEHGREAVRTWRGEAADEVVDLAEKIEPEPAVPPKTAPARKATAPGGTANGSRAANGGVRPAARPTRKAPPARKPAAGKTDPQAGPESTAGGPAAGGAAESKATPRTAPKARPKAAPASDNGTDPKAGEQSAE